MQEKLREVMIYLMPYSIEIINSDVAFKEVCGEKRI